MKTKTFAEWLTEPVSRRGVTSPRACYGGRKWVGFSPASRALWLAFDRADWMLWLAENAGVEHRRVALACAACSWHALRHIPADARHRPCRRWKLPAQGVDLVRRYGLGEDVTTDQLYYIDRGLVGVLMGGECDGAVRAVSSVRYAVLFLRGSMPAYSVADLAANAVSLSQDEAWHREHRVMCTTVRRVIGWPRVARALRAQGVEVMRGK